MSTTALTTTDILPSSVPKLLLTGLNWTAFSMHFEDAICVKGLWGHFDGSVPEPTLSSPPTADEETALAQCIRKIQCQLNQLNLDLITPYLTYNKN
jgi:hypothetical protein